MTYNLWYHASQLRAARIYVHIRFDENCLLDAMLATPRGENLCLLILRSYYYYGRIGIAHMDGD